MYSIRALQPIKRPAKAPLQPDIGQTINQLYNIGEIAKQLQELRDILTQKIEEVDKTIQETKQKVQQELSVKKGEQGLKGEAGKNADEEAIIKRVISKIEIPEPQYIDEEKLSRKIAKLVLDKLPVPQDGKDGKDAEIDHEKLAGIVSKHIETGKIKITTKHVEGFENAQAVLRNFMVRGSLHGAGDTVKAGTNVTLTRNSDGTTTISSSGGAGGTWHVETPTGVIDGANVTFTLSTTPASNSLLLYLNGAYQTAGGVDYTLSGTTITFVDAPKAGSILIAQYQ